MDSLPSYVSGLITVLLLTSFIKIFTSLTLLRYGLGLQSGGFGIVVAGLSLVLSTLVLSTQLEGVGNLDQFLARSADESQLQARLTPFMEKHAHKNITERFNAIALKLAGGSSSQTTPSRAQQQAVLAASFVVSQLQEAFSVGLLLLIPFIVLDLVVANALMALNITQLPLAVVALPLKLFVFFAADGWRLVCEKLLNTYVG